MIDALQDAARRPVSRETLEQVRLYEALLQDEAQRQNLVSPKTLDTLWERHLLDSAQLVRFEVKPGSSWADLGSGAGLPGLVIALLVGGPVTLIEPRRLRADFLHRAVAELGLEGRVSVVAGKAESAVGTFDIITARAVAPATRLLEISTHLSTGNTQWVLPKGRSAQSELAEVERNWHCEARIVPSVTDPGSGILLVRKVTAKGGR